LVFKFGHGSPWHTTGTINVTVEDGTVVEGTFSFEGYNADSKTSKNITEGKFKAELQ
jgi:hypothetical protein